MMSVTLYDYQLDAICNLRDGCILCGGVGSGKSRTSLAYFYTQYGGSINSDSYQKMSNPPDLYIITTARKRDTYEWDDELRPFAMAQNPDLSLYPEQTVKIDSWNNIGKYAAVTGAFFIFDEQRVVGKGAWVKSFLKIAKNNRWILLSATPGDTWMDYVPVFLANGFYRNRTEFNDEHVQYSRSCKFPKVERYFNTGRLIRLRRRILVNMDFQRMTTSHHLDEFVDYDKAAYKELIKTQWDPFDDIPIENASKFCYLLRRIVNSDKSRLEKVLELYKSHPKVIIFYNYDYELELLKSLDYGDDVVVAEWNGHKHEGIPTKHDRWVYLVQYNSGAEGWNCTITDTIIFYSQNYSYKIMAQSAGRIDRLNTPYADLYYYHLKSKSGIDLAVSRALAEKKEFNKQIGKFYEQCKLASFTASK